MSELQRKILIVDDDHDIVRGTKLRLRMHGFETCEASNGREGVDRARSEHPDVILLDVRMPQLDGLSALKEIRGDADLAETPVVMVSASLQDQDAALEAGASYFLRKPFDSGQLLSALARV